jgi:hypothetical protein
MLTIRKSEERGFANLGWLSSHHTFSFADYYDPKHMSFKTLRVINEDIIAAKAGFGTHPHKNMEIITYIVKGALEHQDSMGTKAIIRPGEVQRMSAGTGVFHSEYNPSATEEVHLFQIWISPKQNGVKPEYEQKSFEHDLKTKNLALVASEDARDGSISILQDADMYISRLKKGDHLLFSIRQNRGVWLQVVKGSLQINDQQLKTGDALSSEQAQELKILAGEESEFILFDIGE